ncbi:MAG: FAD-dependent oxidoreductase [Spirochaetes bacterium]|nr:FAD-dependent oxidoreductase [Spirochaetota bacterium]
MEQKVDVLVVGGGPAGICAAVQAARCGAKTALIESQSALGGATTLAGVSFPGLFHAWGRQVIAGIGWELVRQAAALDETPLPDFTRPTERHWEHQVKLNPYVYACLADEACVAAGVDLRFHQQILSVEKGAAWRVRFAGKAGELAAFAANELIDCTGDADVVRLAGFPCARGERVQPATLMLRFSGYDVDEGHRDFIDAEYRKALEDGRLEPGDFAHSKTHFTAFLKGGGGNQVHLFDVDGGSAEGKTRAELRGRAAALRLLRFIRGLPGCSHAVLAEMAWTTGIRETWRILGEETITHDDYTSGRPWPDAVCHSFYPIDLHDENGVVPKPLSPGVVPSVPLGALIPKGSLHLMAAGRCVSSDRLANSALRIQATCMAMGQAAGAAAALSARGGGSPNGVDLAALRKTLAASGAIVPGG